MIEANFDDLRDLIQKNAIFLGMAASLILIIPTLDVVVESYIRNKNGVRLFWEDFAFHHALSLMPFFVGVYLKTSVEYVTRFIFGLILALGTLILIIHQFSVHSHLSGYLLFLMIGLAIVDFGFLIIAIIGRLR